MIVEIGAGLGDLTKHLLEVKDVVAFEVDWELCKILENSFEKDLKSGRLKLHCVDVLEMWGSGELIDRDYDLIANLPYYIATNIILKALSDKRCKSILVMVQKEVAIKFSANSGDGEFCALSVITDKIAKAKLLFDVPKEAFEPIPKVTSAILSIEKFEDSFCLDFADFLKVAFLHPRKTLKKNLLTKYPKSLLETIYDSLGIAHTIRPHEVTTSIFHLLHKNIKRGLENGERTTR